MSVSPMLVSVESLTADLKIELPLSSSYSATMQSHDWNDFKYLLALYRTGKLKEAGRAVGTSDTTVARRIKALEQDLGASLFLRSAAGRYEPTDAALQILSHAEAIELENLVVQERLGRVSDLVSGNVRVSSVPIIVNRIFVPNLESLISSHPHLTVELVPASENLDLAKREADLVVRFARPGAGGLRTKARKLGELAFAVYGARSLTQDQSETVGWITYDDASSDLPQAAWLETESARSSASHSCLRVADADTALEAVACGLGKTLLPRAIAEADRRLRVIQFEGSAPLPVRDVWLLSHVDQTPRSSVAVVKQWLCDLPWDLNCDP